MVRNIAEEEINEKLPVWMQKLEKIIEKARSEKDEGIS
jgi:hypothetical protein